MPDIFYILLAISLLFLITRSFTVLFHELGHALPAVYFTQQKVKVFLGSYGETHNGFKVTLGLLEVWVKPNLFWIHGLCTYTSENITIRKNIAITLLGPLTSFFIAILSTCVIFRFNLHGSLKLVVAFFFMSALFDLLYNLIPDKRPIILNCGTITFNDGYNLKRLFYLNRRFTQDYEDGINFYNNQEYAKANQIFESILFVRNIATVDIYRLAISTLLLAKEYSKALDVYERFEKSTLGLSSEDYCQAGLIKSKMGMTKESLLDYDLSLEMDPLNLYSLNNKGYCLNLLGNFKDAIPLFDLAISTNPTFAYSFSNRGFSKIKAGMRDEGLEDILHSLRLAPENAYGHMHLGVYYLDADQQGKALKSFERAKALDSETHGIDAYLNAVVKVSL